MIAGALAGGVWRTARTEPLADVVAAVRGARLAEARVTGGFAFAPLASPVRGDPSTGPNWRVLAAAAKLHDAVGAAPTPRNLHALGVAALQAARYDDAVQAIGDALRAEADNPAYLSDLAAAHLARASHGGRAVDLIAALAASERAVRLSPPLPEAHFNRALALEKLHLRHEAQLAWDAYVQRFGGDLGWAAEAQRRRDEVAAEALPIPMSPAGRIEQILDEWAAVAIKTPGDALLPELASPDPFFADLAGTIRSASRQGTRALAQSVQGLRAAEAALTRAEYTMGDALAIQVLARRHDVAPIDLWAQRIRLTAAYFAGRAAEGRQEAERLLPALRARGYLALESDVASRLGALDYAAGNYDRALAWYERVTALRDTLRDTTGAASAHLLAAEAYRAMGRDPEAWEHYLHVLAAGAIPNDPVVAHVRFASPSVGSLNRRAPEVALALAREAEHHARAERHAGFLTEALYLQARAQAMLGATAEAERLMRASRDAFAAIADPSARNRYEAEVLFAEAEVFAINRPAASVDAAVKASSRFQSNSTAHRLLALAVVEARAWRALDRPADAETALRKGVALVEAQQGQIARSDFLPSFLDASWDVYSELVDLKAASNDAEGAVQWLDRGYDVRRRWQSAAGATSWAQVSAAGPVVAYLSRRDVLWMWVVRDGTVHQRRVPITSRALIDRAARLTRLLALNGVDAALRTEAAALAAAVLWPATDGFSGRDIRRLALVLDPVLQQVPFAMLPWSRSDNRAAVDVTASVVCPSVLACAATAEPEGILRGRVAALYSSSGNGDLAPLPLARPEAERIGRRYAGATVDIASEATMRAALTGADLVHFAGHAAPDEQYPGRSMLVLTEGGGPGARVPVSRLLADGVHVQTVLLSACRTSSAEQRRGHGGTGVAGEFLRAGVRHVVAAQWDVQDQAASDVMDLVHEALATGAQPWDAVRHAQRVLRQDPTRHPRDWAGYVAFTSASPPAEPGLEPGASTPTQRERP